MIKKFYLSFIFIILSLPAMSQYMYGTTGLLQMPTAEMQEDKTFLFGGSYMNNNITPPLWHYNTFNYYLNITFFPWLEVAYTLTLNKGEDRADGYWPEQTWGKFVNQDRSFHVRLRVWKEGWWKEWTPQITLGANDPATHASYGGGELSTGGNKGNHNWLTRWYIAATKHFNFHGIGELGTHLSYIYGNAIGNKSYKKAAIGANFQFNLLPNDNYKKILNGLDIRMEMCPSGGGKNTGQMTYNIGFNYKIWKDHINIISELNQFKYSSIGIYFKLHL